MIFKEKEVFAKNQGIYLESGRFEVENGSNWEKKVEKFGFVQIWSSFECDMRMIFGV